MALGSQDTVFSSFKKVEEEMTAQLKVVQGKLEHVKEGIASAEL